MNEKLMVVVSVKNVEKFINSLWYKDINAGEIRRLDKTTIKFAVDFDDYEELEEIVKKNKGNIKIIRRSGVLFLLKKIKKEITLLIGFFIFVAILFLLTSFIWAIDIKTTDGITPYELRMQLKELKIIPGIKKSDIDVYQIEEKLKNGNPNILWVRARIEGGALKIDAKSKINPPTIKKTDSRECVASMDGEIKRVYVSKGKPTVSTGDLVKKGDVLIIPVQGKEGCEYPSDAEGRVIANTFYEKEAEIKVSGTELKRTGKTDNDIYFELFNKFFYIKKISNNFEYYDRIEESNNFIKKAVYYEKAESPVEADREEEVRKSIITLQETLLKELKNNAIVTGKSATVTDIDDGKIRVKVVFVVEQDIGVKN